MSSKASYLSRLPKAATGEARQMADAVLRRGQSLQYEYAV
jgi:hypothetical protein